MEYDLLVRGGRVMDGSGLPSYNADVAIKDGKIVKLGRIDGGAAKTLDVGGLVVAPGSSTIIPIWTRRFFGILTAPANPSMESLPSSQEIAGWPWRR